jgi:four helix bundle protein
MAEKRAAVIRWHRDLEVWQAGVALACDIYRLTEAYPRREIYGLASQMRRAASSIPSNIAEGHGRGTTRDYMRFVTIANGSLRELDTYFVLSMRLTYLAEPQFTKLRAQAEQIGRMLTNLRAALSRRIRRQFPNP